ncbi:hypothetical protein BpV2_064 [Bathycoccus sp. RCC1105 virus BpV2]|nr:hypothetical protein BpV2_064 [Bathycoccus sp. RCC1105 virus BpV2]
MSGGIAQLVAVGAQDAHLVGQPEVSFFRSNYKRHTNFAQTVEKQVIQGNPSSNGMSTVRFERKGDMVGYVYIANRGGNITDWNPRISKVELLIGGQVIDEQDYEFSSNLAPTVMNQTYSKSTYVDEAFYPLRFSFCENAQSAIPLIALQYHDVELRITWGATATADAEVYVQFIHLDTDERTALSSTPQNMLITQTQKAVASASKTQELNFNHPMKYLVAANDTNAIPGTDKLKLQINGTDVTDAKTVIPHFTSTPIYYHTTAGNCSADNLILIPFCLDTAKVQPTGSLNFSRLDSARLVSDNTSFANTIYAVNYNILRIENGMGGLMYSN